MSLRLTGEKSGIVSMHDVMPCKLDKIEYCLSRLGEYGIQTVDLLVVPGKSWTAKDLDRLHAWQTAGHQLAGHGWVHHVQSYGSISHHIHGLLISRRAAEHLEIEPPERAALMQRCHTWFQQQGLKAPDLYVPPAWALGGRRTLSFMPSASFRWIETLSGVHDLESGNFIPIPLLGYEADTVFRELSVSAFNQLSLSLWNIRGVIRMAIHPDDFELRLRFSLGSLLEQWKCHDIRFATLARALRS